MTARRDLAAPDAERAVVAACLREPSALELLREELALDVVEFREKACRNVYQALCNIDDRGQAVTSARVRAELSRIGVREPDTILHDLENSHTRSLEADARLIRERSIRRGAVKRAREIIESAFSTASVEELVDEGQRAFLGLADGSPGRSLAARERIWPGGPRQDSSR